MADTVLEAQDNYQKLIAAGVTPDFLAAEAAKGKSGLLKGSNIDNQDYQPILDAFKASNVAAPVSAAPTLPTALSTPFSFDYNAARTAAEADAAALFEPRMQQLNVIRELNKSRVEESKITTREQFDAQLQKETELVNNRGAYFSGGAIANEQQILTDKTRALKEVEMQGLVNDLDILGQQAGLTSDQVQFIKDRIFNDETSAYNRFKDERSFGLSVFQTQLQQYNTDREFQFQVMDADRRYSLDAKQLDLQEKQFKANYDMSDKEFKLTMDKFNYDKKTMDSQMALDLAKFTYSKSQKGVDNTKNDIISGATAKVLSGEWSREGAKGYIEIYYPNEGNVIYDRIPDGTEIIKKDQRGV
jgi:hypothetical protein